MGNSRMGAKQTIHRLCKWEHFDEKDLYAKSKRVLELYRDLCVQCPGTSRTGTDEPAPGEDEKLRRALDYLEHFPADEDQGTFEHIVYECCESSWMAELVHTAVLKVREFAGSGSTYETILTGYYMSQFPLTEGDLVGALRVDRSTYYRKKKEAVLLFGVYFWGQAIRQMRCTLGLAS